MIVTPNPEFVVRAQEDEEFRRILNRADLAVPDGVGLRMAAKVLTLPTSSSTIVKIFQLFWRWLLTGSAAILRPAFLDVLPETVSGVDLMFDLCQLAAEKGWTVFFLGGRDGVAEGTAQRLQKQFANLKVVGVYEGEAAAEFDQETRRVIRPTDILFVAYGAPKQEKWIARNLPHLPVKIAIGVGGAFDFVSGRRKRAPQALRRLGLEWLWRLIQEPPRLPRILNAAIKFPLLVCWHKLVSR
jgi:N-acetylglucosaminyldiphosphoundecaprenol N-acetyl-beta-D-mannosaminyltransferase